MGFDAPVRIRARVEQRAHHIEVGRLLFLHLLGLRKARPRLPLRVDRGPEGRRAVARGGEIGIGSARDEEHRHVELPVDHGHQEGARGIAGPGLVDRRMAVEQRTRRLDMTLAGGVQQRREPALCGNRRIDLFRIEVVCRTGRITVAGRGAFFRVGRRDLPGREQLARRMHGGLHLAGRGRLTLHDRGVEHLALSLGRRAIQRALLRDVDRLRRDARVRAALEEHTDRVGAVLRRREHQRGLAPCRLARIRIRAVIEQHLHQRRCA